MSLRRSVAAAVAMATVSLASAAWGSPWALKPGEFYSELSGSFYSARSYNQNSDGKRFSLGGTLEERMLRSHNELGWKKRASMWIDVPFVSRTFAGNESGSLTSTGLGDLGFGVRFGLVLPDEVDRHVGLAPLALEFGWTTPLGGNRRLFPGTTGSGGVDGSSYGILADGTLRDSSAFFNTGLQSLSMSLEMGSTVGKRTYWTLGGGVRSHFLTAATGDSTSRYLSVATASASVGRWVGSRLLVSGSFRGEWAVSQGRFYDRIQQPIAGSHGPDLEPASIVAGSRFTYRVDERMDVYAGTWHTLSGRNVLHTDQFFAGIAWKQTGLDRLAGALGGTRSH